MEMKFPDAVERVHKKADSGLLAVKSNAWLRSNLGIILMVLISAAVRFLVNTDEVPSLKEIAFDSILIYVISTLTFTIRYRVGIDRGKGDEGYRKAVEDFEKLREKTQENSSFNELQDFCIDLQKESLDAYRREILLRCNISLDEYYAKYLHMKGSAIMKLPLPLHTRTALIKCGHARVEEIGAIDVLASRSALQSSHMKLLGVSGAKQQKRDLMLRSMKSLLLSLFTGYFGFKLVEGFTVLLLFEWAFQMIPVINAYINGEWKGYCNITVTETCYKQNQTDILRMFQNRRKKGKDDDRSQDQSDRTGGLHGQCRADGNADPNTEAEIL